MTRLLRLSASALATTAFLGLQLPSLMLPVFAQTSLPCATPGKDGTPSSPLTGVVNTYYPGQGAPAAGATSLTVGAPVGGTPIQAGDLLIVVQMQGADFDFSNTSAYGDGVGGDVTPNPPPPLLTQPPLPPSTAASGFLGTPIAGNYEYVVATGPVTGATLPIQGTGPNGGLVNSYASAPATASQGQRSFQVIRVPQYQTATIASLTALPWNGSTGGIVALDVVENLNLTGTIEVSGQGFRGGAGIALSGAVPPPVLTNNDFVTVAPTPGATVPFTGPNAANGSKGEGIAGTPRYIVDRSGVTPIRVDNGNEGYPGGSFGRGAPGTAGGGSTDGTPADRDGVANTGFPNDGNYENSGGGGGSNGGNGGAGGRAWNLFASPFIPGSPSPSTAIGQPSGGFGGAVFPALPSRVVLGGGGGAGTTNDGTSDLPAVPSNGIGSSGAPGGGMVLVRSGSLGGGGTINANGASAFAVRQDGGGGGGAGGSVVITAQTGTLAGLTINVNGGRGGDAVFNAPHGPGGGGGGGVVFATPGAIVNRLGGANGLTGTPPTDPRDAQAGAGLSTPIPPADPILGINSGARCFTPNLVLVKRVTALTRSGVTTQFTQFVDDPNDQNDTLTGWSQFAPVGILGITPAEPLQSGDEAEYTVYFLSNGRRSALAVSLCDQIPPNTALIANTPQIQLNTTPIAPGGTVFSPLAALPQGNACLEQTNPNGSIIYDLGEVSNLVGSNFGFVRFRVRVD